MKSAAASGPARDDSDLWGEADRERFGPEGINRAGDPRAGRRQRLRTWDRTVMDWDGILKDFDEEPMGKLRFCWGPTGGAMGDGAAITGQGLRAANAGWWWWWWLLDLRTRSK